MSIWSLEINLSLGCFRVVLLVGSNDDGIFSSSLECFVGMGFIDHFKFDFPPRTIYFSSKWRSHKIECFLCFVGFQPLRLTNRIHSLFSSKFFKENETLWYVLFRSWHNQRSIRPEMFCEKEVLRNFTKFTGKHLRQRLFFNKVAGLRPVTLLKKWLWYMCFLVNFVEVLRTLFT